MSVFARHWKPVAVTCLLTLPLIAWGNPGGSAVMDLQSANTEPEVPEESAFVEARYGVTEVYLDGFEFFELDTYSVSYGVQSKHLSFSFEHTRSREDIPYHTNAAMAQIEGDNQLKGFGFFGRLGVINVSVSDSDEPFVEHGLSLAYGGGVRYQFKGGFRLFYDVTVQNSDLTNYSLGVRFLL